MKWPQAVYGAMLVAGLVAIAFYYAWRQITVLRHAPDPRSAEGAFLRRLAYRRLINSGLMLVLAGLLAGALVFFENAAQELADQQDARESAGEETVLSGAERSFARNYSLYWIAFLLVFLAVLGLAAADLWAIRCYGKEQFRRLREDRRAMIEREAARLRERRLNSGGEPPDVSRN